MSGTSCVDAGCGSPAKRQRRRSRPPEDHIAEAFRIVAYTIEADCLPDPVQHGRAVLKGRQACHDEAIRLAQTGVSSRSVARVVGQPYLTVYSWMRKAGVAQTRSPSRAGFR